MLVNQVPDWAELHHMANSMASAAFEASAGQDYYKIGTAADIQYLASGGSDDWARGVAGIKWTFLIELPPHRKAFSPTQQIRGFLLPSKQILPVANSVFQGFQQMISSIRQLGYGKV